MTALFEFFSGLLDGVALVALALCLGGVACTLVILRPMQDQAPCIRLAGHTLLRVSLLSICVVAGLHVIRLALKGLALADGFAGATVYVFFQTHLFRSGLWAVLLAVGVAASVTWFRRRMTSVPAWGTVLLLLCLFMVNEVEQSHTAGRSRHPWLLVATLVHVCGAATWAGGMIHLLILRWFTRKEDASPVATNGQAFFSFGNRCVGLVVGSGNVSFMAVRRWLAGIAWDELRQSGVGQNCAGSLRAGLWQFRLSFRSGSGPGVMDASGFICACRRLLRWETILAGTLLVTAVSLTGLPTSVDVAKAVVAPADLWIMYAPKIPHLNGPERTLVDAPALTDLRTGASGKKKT